MLSSNPSTSVVTTDFFGFDTSDNHYGLKGLAPYRKWATPCSAWWPAI